MNFESYYPTLFINLEQVWRKNILCDTLAKTAKIHSVKNRYAITLSKSYRIQDVFEPWLAPNRFHE